MDPYPSTLPAGDLQVIVDDLRSGTVSADKALFAKCLWELAGYALLSSIGEPATPVGPTPIQSCPCTDEEVIGHLESLINANGCCSSLNLPWIFILKWALRTLAELL